VDQTLVRTLECPLTADDAIVDGGVLAILFATSSSVCVLAGVYSDEIGQESNYLFCQSLTAKVLYYLRARFRSLVPLQINVLVELTGNAHREVIQGYYHHS
jgi:hypothetical protein